MLLTESSRQNLLLVVTVLALVCFFSSFLLFVCAAYIKITIDSKMKLLETYNSDVLPGIFIFVGLVNLIQNVVVVIVSYRLMTIDMRDQLVPTMVYILIGGIVLVIFEAASAIASFVHISILDSEFGEGLNKAMNKYIEGGELKREMDSVQMIYSCCGDRSYVDWFRYQWIEPESLRTYGTSVKKYLHTDGKYYSDDAPFSCCDPRSPRPCIHHHIHDNKRHHAYNVNVETTLYVAGCRATLMSIYGHVLLTVGLIATVIACVKTSVLLLFRLLQTSLSKTQQWGDWEATTNGYIYKDDPDAEEGLIRITDQDEGNTTEAETTEAETAEGESTTAPEDGDTTAPEEEDMTASEAGDMTASEFGDMTDPGDEASTAPEDEGALDENENRRYGGRMYRAVRNRRKKRSYKTNRNVSCLHKASRESERSRQLTDELCQRFLFPGRNKPDESFSEGAVDSRIVDNVRRHISSRTSLTADEQRSMTSLPASVRGYGNRCRSNNNCHHLLLTEDSTALGSSCDERSEGQPRDVSALALFDASELSGNQKYQGNKCHVDRENPRTSSSLDHSFCDRQFPGTSLHVEDEERHVLVDKRINRKCTSKEKCSTSVRASASSSSCSTSSTSSVSSLMPHSESSTALSPSSEVSCGEASRRLHRKPVTTTGESRVWSGGRLKDNSSCSLNERRGYMTATDQWTFNQGCWTDDDQLGNFNPGYMPDIDQGNFNCGYISDIGQGNFNQDYLTNNDQLCNFNPGYMPDIDQGNFNPAFVSDIDNANLNPGYMPDTDQGNFCHSIWSDINHREPRHGYQNDAKIRKDKQRFLTGRCRKITKPCHVTGSGQQDIAEFDDAGRHCYGPSTVLCLFNEAYNKASDHIPDTGQSLVPLKQSLSLEPTVSETSYKTVEDIILDIYDDGVKPVDMLDDLEVSGITMRISIQQAEPEVKSPFLKELDQCGDVESTGTKIIGNTTRLDASLHASAVCKQPNRNHVHSFYKQNNIQHLPVVTASVSAAPAQSACRSIRLTEPSSLPRASDALCASVRCPALDPLAKKDVIDHQCKSEDGTNDWRTANGASRETTQAALGHLLEYEKLEFDEVNTWGAGTYDQNTPMQVSYSPAANPLYDRVLISPFN